MPNISDEEKDDVLEDVAEYFSVLGNETRLKMLKLIENEAKDIRMIARILRERWDIEVAVPNTRKHLKKLIGIGVVTKYPAVRKDDGQIVMYYRCVSGSFDAVLNVLNNLNVLSGYISKADTIVGIKEMKGTDDTIKKILSEFPSKNKLIKSELVRLDGGDIVQRYPLEKKIVQIGRIHPTENDISLQDTDRTVGRTQSRIIYESGRYYLEDIGSKNGTYRMDQQQKQFVKLEQGERVELNDGYVMRLGLLNTILVFRRGGA